MTSESNSLSDKGPDAVKQRVLFIENSVDFTGAFKCALREAELQREEAYFVFALPTRSKNTERVEKAGFKVYPIPYREIRRSFVSVFLYLPFLLINYFRLRRILKKEGITCIRVNDYYNLLGSMACLFGFRGSLITSVRFLPSAKPSLLNRIWSCAAQRYSSRVIAVSAAVLRQLPPSPRNLLVYDPVDFPVNHPSLDPPADGKTHFIYLANYTWGKGQEWAIRAFVNAVREESSMELDFYGGDMGLEKNIRFRSELEKAVGKMGIRDKIHFHSFTPDVEFLIRSSHVLLNFSEAESFSLTCAEASFYVRPVIATRCGGPEELIVHGETGLLVDLGDLSGMTAALLRLHRDPTERLRMGQAGSERMRRVFTVREFVNAMRDVYRPFQ
jgi:glycosyltransferase involved in cell wall biosynthesis